MIFSELYSVYYHTVARVLETAFDSPASEKELQSCIEREAFSESTLTILPALKSGKWPLLNPDLSPVLRHRPTMPLTLLEKQWLKAIADDPHVKLFGVEIPELDDVEPLFTRDDYRIYDQYADGDPFEDASYIQHFQLLLSAMKSGRPVQITMVNRHGKRVSTRLFPKSFEYSSKDDKIRVIVDGCRLRCFNLGRVEHCEYYDAEALWHEMPREEHRKSLTLWIVDELNTPERAMLHFAHFKRRAERTEDGKYILSLEYDESDEAELVIRVLSFGPYVKVLEPQSFVNLIRAKLLAQKSCELR